MEAAKCLDKNALVELYRIGGKEFLLRMIDGFLTNAPQKLASSKKSLERKDLREVHLAIHSLRASAANLGAISLQELAEQVEDLARQGKPASIAGLLDQTERIMVDTLRYLQEERKGWEN